VLQPELQSQVRACTWRYIQEGLARLEDKLNAIKTSRSFEHAEVHLLRNYYSWYSSSYSRCKPVSPSCAPASRRALSTPRPFHQLLWKRRTETALVEGVISAARSIAADLTR